MPTTEDCSLVMDQLPFESILFLFVYSNKRCDILYKKISGNVGKVGEKLLKKIDDHKSVKSFAYKYSKTPDT